MTTTLSPTQRATADETYEEVKDLLYATVWKVVRQFGGDFDELMSEANVAFLEAYSNFDGSSSFSSWVRQSVWYKCVDLIRGRLTEQSRYAKGFSDESVNRVPCSMAGADADVRGILEIPDRPHSSWKIQSMIEELTEDAALVVKLTIETPAELEAVVQAKGGQPRNLRSSLRQYLAEMGWTACRIAESFNEVRRVLAE